MPSAVSTRVSDRPAARETVCAPLAYEPFAIPILATPWATETSVKSGFELGKLAPIRTVWTLPLTWSIAAPVLASVRLYVCGAALLLPPLPLDPDDPPAPFE